MQLQHSLALTTIIIFFFARATYSWYEEKGDNSFRLPRRDPVQVAHVDDIKVQLGQTNTIKTLSVNPPIFEVANFLSAEECNYLIFLAKRAGLKESPLHRPWDGDYRTTRDVFSTWDVNNDSFVDAAEFTFIRDKGNLYLTEVEMMSMLELLNIDKNDDNKMDYAEFQSVTAERIREYFVKLSERFPKLRSRYSEQAWLWHYGAFDQLLEGFHERMSRLTGLPHDLIEVSEPMQVVRYGEGGHYYCHHDSDEVDPSIPCCTHNMDEERCRTCRYLTIMFFLNNVTRGGQTVFPVADNKTFSSEDWQQEATIKCNLGDNCEKSNLVIQPKQGTALLWYNHYLDANTGWMGGLDPMTYHGGCDVTTQTNDKWIANTWINIIGSKGSRESKLGWMSQQVKDEL